MVSDWHFQERFFHPSCILVSFSYLFLKLGLEKYLLQLSAISIIYQHFHLNTDSIYWYPNFRPTGNYIFHKVLMVLISSMEKMNKRVHLNKHFVAKDRDHRKSVQQWSCWCWIGAFTCIQELLNNCHLIHKITMIIFKV